MPPSSLKIVAGYAKSNRSTCKTCSNSIANKELRLGLTSRDPRGFDATRWHHMRCFSFDFDSTDSIKGFDSLKGVDQEALKKLLEDVERTSREKVNRRSEDIENETQETHTKEQASEDTEDKTQESATEKRTGADIKNKTLETDTKELTSEDVENKTQENHIGKRTSEDMENNRQETHTKEELIEDMENKKQENRTKKRTSEDVENKMQENHTKKRRREDTESKTQENHIKKRTSEDAENEVQENHTTKRTSEDMENNRQETHTKEELIEDMENKKQENRTKKRTSEDVENKMQENHTKKRRSEDTESKTQENHIKKRTSEDAENEVQENHTTKRTSEDMENKTQENHSKKRTSEDAENKTQENRTKKHRLSITRETEVKVALSASDIKDKYRDIRLLPKWKAFQTLIFRDKDDGLVNCSRIAAFDFDGCLVNTSVKRVGADAWSLMYPSIPEKLLKLLKDGFKLVIFTNESNIERWTKQRKKAVDSKIGRLNNFIKHVNVPIQVFIACGFDRGGRADPFRKPKPGMWHIMETNFNSGIRIDMDQSFYVGDAAGRELDHSDADKKFAEAVGLKFYLPEDYFDA